MADDKFRLPGSSYEELVKIIRAYSHPSGPASPADVANVIGIHETVVSRNNGFLLAAGVVEGGNRKSLTDPGRQLARALDHNMADEIARQWRSIVEQTEFLERLVSAVRIRNGMEPASLQTHVAYTAGQPNKGTVKTGSATVVEILKTAGLLQERDGKLHSVGAEGTQPDVAESGVIHETATAVRRPEPAETFRAPAIDVAVGTGVSVQIRVAVNCSVDELPQLAENLGRLLRDLPRLTSQSSDPVVE